MSSAKACLTARSEEIKRLDDAIERKRERFVRLRARLTGGTAQLTGMPNGGGNGNGPLANITELVSLAAEIDADIARLGEMQNRLADEIARVGNANACAVLEYRYVDRMSWTRIAAKMRYTRDGIYKLHGRALEMYEGVIERDKC